jgi:hypothetical protein
MIAKIRFVPTHLFNFMYIHMILQCFLLFFTCLSAVVHSSELELQLFCHENDYAMISYESLDIQQLSLTKTSSEADWKRSVYYDKLNNCFVKLWSASYPLALNFQRALQSSYYQARAQIFGIVVDQDGKIRGYTTAPCLVVEDIRDTSFKLFYEHNTWHYKRLQSSYSQPPIFQEFYSHLLLAAKETGLVYLDLTPGNLGFYNQHYYLLDLECVYTIPELVAWWRQKPGEMNRLLEFLPSNYAEFILSCIFAASNTVSN